MSRKKHCPSRQDEGEGKTKPKSENKWERGVDENTMNDMHEIIMECEHPWKWISMERALILI